MLANNQFVFEVGVGRIGYFDSTSSHLITKIINMLSISLDGVYNNHVATFKTFSLVTLGLLPPIAPGRIDPVSWYLHRILDTQPCDTRSWREITHGRIPWWAISTILCRIWLGKGRPFMKTPPSWFTRPWPNGVETENRHIPQSWLNYYQTIAQKQLANVNNNKIVTIIIT